MANYIYGKVKRKQNLYRVIESDTEIYETENLVLNGVDYNPATLIEDEELYKVSSFSQTDFILDFLQNDLDSVNYDQITKEDLKKLSFICTVQGNLYFFQAINSSFFISKKWFSIDELTLETNKPIITINSYADAIYDKDNDTLYFKKLASAQKIFKGMDQLYRSATDAETQVFLENDFLEVDEGFQSGNVTIPNRKRIALVNETLSKFSDDEKQAIYNYTNQYGQVNYENGKFKIESDDDLKFVLWGIEQRFYTTPIGAEKRVANSIISI
ncbi:MAG: ATP F0F1 synthase synthase [Bacteroidetes bacterium]|nr:ATP F0F1 synthase synthase [Bacteroidota bacterium]